MNRLFIFIFILSIASFSFESFAQRSVISATRGENESFRQAYLRNLKSHSRNFKQTQKVTDFATKLENTKLRAIPNLNPKQYQKALTLFKMSRDKRLLIDNQGRQRRLPWLYPKDGCFNRADAVKNIFTRGKIPIKKVFVFGDLRAKSSFAPRGYVSWWYHVAAAFRFENQVYIIDPALDAYKPLKIQNWIAKQTQTPEKVEVSICHRDSVTPDSRCSNPQVQDGMTLKKSLRGYLDLEEKNLKKLGYNSSKELGSTPYWKREEGLIVPKELANFFKIVETFQ